MKVFALFAIAPLLSSALAQQYRVAIVGAGAGGSSAAYWTALAGARNQKNVTIDVFERSNYVGGRTFDRSNARILQHTEQLSLQEAQQSIPMVILLMTQSKLVHPFSLILPTSTCSVLLFNSNFRCKRVEEM